MVPSLRKLGLSTTLPPEFITDLIIFKGTEEGNNGGGSLAQTPPIDGKWGGGKIPLVDLIQEIFDNQSAR